MNKNIVVGGRYETNNYGWLEVLSIKNHLEVRVRFIATGYVIVVQKGNLVAGKVKDPFSPKVFGVGFLGVGVHKANQKRVASKQYRTWLNMLKRCYYEEFLKRRPTYIGCSVCEEWHNFQTFAKWFDENYIEGYQLDKDCKFEGNKIYSADTCEFVTSKENSVKASAKHYTFMNPDGELVYIYNLNEFCKVNNLDSGAMSSVHLGRKHFNSHKGWTKAPSTTDA